MYVEYEMTIVSVHPWTETFKCAYSTSQRDGGLEIKRMDKNSECAQATNWKPMDLYAA